MKKIIFSTAFLFIAFCSNAQEKAKSTTTTTEANEDAMMKAWQAFMTPGEMHKMLARSEGTWKEEITMWMAPGAPPTKSVAKAQNRINLNGLYQQSTHTGDFGGMPFEGIGTTGYDNGRKIFVSTWVDNMGSGIMYMEGPWDEATKSINFRGTQTDPMTGKSMAVREVFRIIDDKSQIMEMYETRDGKERKTMEIALTKL